MSISAAGITPVGVSSYSDYPSQAKTIEQVASWQGMNLERIVALKPDVVLAWRGGNAERQVNQLQSLGIHVLWVQTSTIEEIIATETKLKARQLPSLSAAELRFAKQKGFSDKRLGKLMGSNQHDVRRARHRAAPPRSA